jgi:hypothetical protein
MVESALNSVDTSPPSDVCSCWYTVPIRIVSEKCETCGQDVVAYGELSVEIAGTPVAEFEQLSKLGSLLLDYKLCRVDNLKKRDAVRWTTLPFPPADRQMEHQTPESSCKADAPAPRLRFRWVEYGVIEEVQNEKTYS